MVRPRMRNRNSRRVLAYDKSQIKELKDTFKNIRKSLSFDKDLKRNLATLDALLSEIWEDGDGDRKSEEYKITDHLYDEYEKYKTLNLGIGDMIQRIEELLEKAMKK